MKSATRRLIPLFVAVIIIVPMSTVLVHLAGSRVAAANQSLANSLQVITRLEEILSTMNDIEVGSHGFLLTGDDRYLAPYDEAVAHMNGELRQLDNWAKSGMVSHGLAMQAAELIGRKLAKNAELISLRQEKGLDAAMPAVRSGEGKRLMDDLRACIRRMADEETAQLIALVQQRDRLDRQRKLAGPVLAFLMSCFIIWTFYRIKHEIDLAERRT